MVLTEHFRLQWNEFESNFANTLKTFKHEKQFFDVTLACADGQCEAHQLVLSASSLFFHTVLIQNQHSHPLLYLKGTKHSDLAAILDFIYHGEVNVPQEELSNFLSVAGDLRVKGLTKPETFPQTVDDKRTNSDSCIIDQNFGNEQGENASASQETSLVKSEPEPVALRDAGEYVMDVNDDGGVGRQALESYSENEFKEEGYDEDGSYKSLDAGSSYRNCSIFKPFFRNLRVCH